jgi:hypothetical protein
MSQSGLLIRGVGLSVECVLAPRSVYHLDCSCQCLLQACLQVVQFCCLGVKLLAPIFIVVHFLDRVRHQASALCLICFDLDLCRRSVWSSHRLRFQVLVYVMLEHAHVPPRSQLSQSLVVFLLGSVRCLSSASPSTGGFVLLISYSELQTFCVSACTSDLIFCFGGNCCGVKPVYF